MAVKGKLPPMKKVKPASKAKAKPAEVDDAPLPQAVSKPKPKKHERTGKKSEADLIAKGKELAAQYLMQRDGMDLETATMVTESMDPSTIRELTDEAATAVLDKTAAATAPSAPATSPETLPGAPAEPDADEDAGPARDFLEVPALADDDTFPEIVIRCRDAAVTKNEAEKLYKADKKVIDATLKEAGIGKDAPLNCLGIRLVRYTGKSPRMLSEQKLLEKGVSPDIIAKCWVSGSYDDVRITTPKV